MTMATDTHEQEEAQRAQGQATAQAAEQAAVSTQGPQQPQAAEGPGRPAFDSKGWLGGWLGVTDGRPARRPAAPAVAPRRDFLTGRGLPSRAGSEGGDADVNDYQGLLELVNRRRDEHSPMTKEQRERMERRRRNDELVAGIGDMVRSLGNLFTVNEYAPNMYGKGTQRRVSERYERLMAKDDAEREAWYQWAMQGAKLQGDAAAARRAARAAAEQRQYERALDEAKLDLQEESIEQRREAARLRDESAKADREQRARDEEANRGTRRAIARARLRQRALEQGADAYSPQTPYRAQGANNEYKWFPTRQAAEDWYDQELFTWMEQHGFDADGMRNGHSVNEFVNSRDLLMERTDRPSLDEMIDGATTSSTASERGQGGAGGSAATNGELRLKGVRVQPSNNPLTPGVRDTIYDFEPKRPIGGARGWLQGDGRKPWNYENGNGQ